MTATRVAKIHMCNREAPYKGGGLLVVTLRLAQLVLLHEGTVAVDGGAGQARGADDVRVDGSIGVAGADSVVRSVV